MNVKHNEGGGIAEKDINKMEEISDLKNHEIIKEDIALEDGKGFWKEKCQLLTTKYYIAIKRLREDNEELMKIVKRDYSQYKQSIIEILKKILKKVNKVSREY